MTGVEKQNIGPRLTSAPFSFAASLFLNLLFWRLLARPVSQTPQLHHCPALSLPVLRWSHRLSRFFRGPRRSLFPPESLAHAFVLRREGSSSHENSRGPTLPPA